MISNIDQLMAPTTTNPATEPKKELGQEDFLKLLVAQLKNQDPNNPADNGEFLGQIAQFSMVSGIDDLGVSFEGVAGSLYTNQAMQASSLVGKEVLAETNVAYLDEGESVDGVISLPDDANAVNVQIRDASGELIESLEFGKTTEGTNSFSWNGLASDGSQMPEGAYFLHAEAVINGTLEAVPIQIYSEVDSVSVDRQNTNILLHLASEESIGLSEVREYK